MVRSTILKAVILSLLIAFPFPGSTVAETSDSDIAKKTEDALNKIKAYMIEKRNEALEHGKVLLKKTDAEIEELETKAAEASGEAKTTYQAEIDSLKQKRTQASLKLDELQNASESSWDSAKHGFAEAYKALYDAYTEAVAKFR